MLGVDLINWLMLYPSRTEVETALGDPSLY